VELDAPGALAGAIGLQTGGVVREGNGIGRKLERIAVPLKAREAARQLREDGIVGRFGRLLDVEPADLRGRHGADA
jgi:hypothetical protein